MAFDEGLFALVQEALEPMGAVTMRRMLGGATLYLDGIVFAILGDDALWFKADAASDAVWDEAGCQRITMVKRDGGVATMNYRRAPDEVYDDPGEMRRWAEFALQAGLRGAAKKRR